jgi:hypothetical protein
MIAYIRHARIDLSGACAYVRSLWHAYKDVV